MVLGYLPLTSPFVCEGRDLAPFLFNLTMMATLEIKAAYLPDKK